MHERALKTRRASKTSCNGGANIACWEVLLLNLMSSVNSRHCARSADHAESKHFKSGEFQKSSENEAKFCIYIKLALHFCMLFRCVQDDNKCSTCKKLMLML